MEKIPFTFSDSEETVEFFVLEQTKFNGCQYLLVTESQEEESEAYILKDLSKEEDEEATYVMVDSENELQAVGQIFAEILEDVDLEFDVEEGN